MTALLEARDVVKRCGGLAAVDGVSISLEAGARVADAYLGGLDVIEDAGAAEDGTAISVQNVDERGP